MLMFIFLRFGSFYCMGFQATEMQLRFLEALLDFVLKKLETQVNVGKANFLHAAMRTPFFGSVLVRNHDTILVGFNLFINLFLLFYTLLDLIYFTFLNKISKISYIINRIK